MTRRLVVVAILAAVAGGVVWRQTRGRDFVLPPELSLEDVVREVAASAVSPAADAGWLQPSHSLNAAGGFREALLAPPPSSFTAQLSVPAGGALRFAFGVDGPGKRDDDAAGIRFAIDVDGREAFARTVNPAETRHDRRWFEGRIPLGGGERTVAVTFRTSRDGGGSKLAGTAGWADVRVVRERRRPRQVASPSAPNAVVILVDTLRADRLGCYGLQPSPSPALDAFAARGLLFERMIAQSSWTLPTTATLLTGLHPRDHRVEGWGAGTLSVGLTTLAEQAAAAGITTFGVSANPLVSQRTNFAQGFETFLDYAWDPKRRNWAPAADVNGPFLRWLERNHGHRFLAYLHYMEPHDPYTPPPAHRPPAPPGVRAGLVDGYLDGLTPRNGEPASGRLTDAEIRHLHRLYDGEVRAWDDAFAEVLAALARLGLADSTIVVVTSDHGEELREHGRLKHGWHLYDETVHVPLVIGGPSVTPGRVPEQVQGIDLFPTVAALLGIGTPDGLPGRSLVGTREDRPVFSETHHGIAPDGKDMRILSLRTSEWKLIHTPLLARWELYDLTRDPGERDDLHGKAPEGAALVDQLTAWEAAAPPPPASTAPDPALRQRLKALGYVE